MASINSNLEKVKEHLEPNEKNLHHVAGIYERKSLGSEVKKNGIFVTTEKRIVFYSKKLIGYDLESFPFKSISSIEMSKNLMGHSITFFASGNQVKIKWISSGNNISEFVSYVNSKLGGESTSNQIQTNSTEEKVTIDIPDQIRKLSELKEQGILTDEEFTNKKSELLAKM